MNFSHSQECVRVDKTESIRKSDGSQSGPGVVLMSLDDSSEVEEVDHVQICFVRRLLCMDH